MIPENAQFLRNYYYSLAYIRDNVMAAKKPNNILNDFFAMLTPIGRQKVRDSGKTLTTDDMETSGWRPPSKPEEFTKQHLIEPILTNLGFKIYREGERDLKKGQRFVDYIATFNEYPVVIEAKPFNMPLDKKGGAIEQVISIMKDCGIGCHYSRGIATNGNEWIVLDHFGSIVYRFKLLEDINGLKKMADILTLSYTPDDKMLFFSMNPNERKFKKRMESIIPELNLGIRVRPTLNVIESVENKHLKKLGEGHKVGEGVYVLTNAEVKRLKLTDTEKKLLRKWYGMDKFQSYYPMTSSKSFIFADIKSSKTIQRLTKLRGHLESYRPILGKRTDPYAIPKLKESDYTG